MVLARLNTNAVGAGRGVLSGEVRVRFVGVGVGGSGAGILKLMAGVGSPITQPGGHAVFGPLLTPSARYQSNTRVPNTMTPVEITITLETLLQEDTMNSSTQPFILGCPGSVGGDVCSLRV